MYLQCIRRFYCGAFLLACMCIIIFFFLILTAYAGRVVIDPGHSPNAGGAVSSAGIKEHIYNDALASKVIQKLKASGLDVHLTRKPGENLSLQARSKNTADKDLFLSIHHDAVQPQFTQKINGNLVSRYARGFSLFVSRKNGNFDDSVKFAREIGKELVKLGLTPSTHHGEPIRGENRKLLDSRYGIYEFNDLIVLKSSKAPAVLMEAGVLVHPEEERLLANPVYQEQMAEAVTRGILNGFKRK